MKTTKQLFLTAFFTIALLFTHPQRALADDNEQATPADPIIMTASDIKDTLTLAKDQKLTLTLEDEELSGSTWFYSQFLSPNALLCESIDESTALSIDPASPGILKHHKTFSFIGMHTGQSLLIFSRAKPNSPSIIEKTTTMVVNVTEPVISDDVSDTASE